MTGRSSTPVTGAPPDPQVPRRSALRDELVDAGLLVPTGVDGIHGWAGDLLPVLDAVHAVTASLGADGGPVRVDFPPVMPRELLERTGYLRSFPHLAGAVHAFAGDDEAHVELGRRLASGDDWAPLTPPADAALVPAACLPLYPTCAGVLPPAGCLFAMRAWCFRHEPSRDPARAQAFRVQELVYLGGREEAVGHRDRWVDRGIDLLDGLGLAAEAVVATDPFFGRVGPLLAGAQRRDTRKMEIVVPIDRIDEPTAVMSANAHGDHFGAMFGIATADGEPAHSSCAGFGVERVALALVRRHGIRTRTWPAPVRARMWN